MALICPWLGLLKELGPTIWKKIYPTNKGWSIEAEMSHFLDLQQSMETTISNNSQAEVKKKAFSQINAANVYILSSFNLNCHCHLSLNKQINWRKIFVNPAPQVIRKLFSLTNHSTNTSVLLNLQTWFNVCEREEILLLFEQPFSWEHL